MGANNLDSNIDEIKTDAGSSISYAGNEDGNNFVLEEQINKELVAEQYEKLEELKDAMIYQLGRSKHSPGEIEEWKRDMKTIKKHGRTNSGNIFTPDKPMPPEALDELNSIYEKWMNRD